MFQAFLKILLIAFLSISLNAAPQPNEQNPNKQNQSAQSPQSAQNTQNKQPQSTQNQSPQSSQSTQNQNKQSQGTQDSESSQTLAQYLELIDPIETLKHPDTQKLDISKILPLYMHNAFYIMPYYYTINDIQPTLSSQQQAPNRRYETKFQVSFKMPIQRINPRNTFYFGYTQTYFFQNYNKDDSRPFRDIDYKPELFWQYAPQTTIRYIQAGYAHTSNGERKERSRTRNRLFVAAHFQWILGENKWLKLGTRPRIWTYFGNHKDSFLEDNGDLVKYQGYGELLVYAQTKRNLLELELSPFVADYSHYRPFFRAGYSFRISANIAFYAQYFNGYGDNMYEYNHLSSHFGVGVRIWQDY